MLAGDILDLDVTTIAHGGVCVARHDGRVVFLPDAIPGERIRARITEVKRSFARAVALEVLDASPHRRAHVWAAADISRDPEERVGGADLGHIRLGHQRELKAQVLAEAFSRFASREVTAAVEQASAPGAAETADGTGWRTRVGLHIDEDGRIGPFAARSHRVIPVADHPLATPEIAEAARRLGAAPDAGRARRAGSRAPRIDLVQPADGEVRVLRSPGDDEVVVERAGESAFRLAASGFWQVHRLAASTLHAAVTDAVAGLDPSGWSLDLYGGVGLFADALVRAGAERVTSVEAAASATAHAAENLAGRATAENGRVERWIAALDGRIDAAERSAIGRGAVVLDPPRSGAGVDVVERIAALRPERIVYVACDPVALARDAGALAMSGYELRSLRAFDLFPHSHHLEAVAQFGPTALS